MEDTDTIYNESESEINFDSKCDNQEKIFENKQLLSDLNNSIQQNIQIIDKVLLNKPNKVYKPKLYTSLKNIYKSLKLDEYLLIIQNNYGKDVMMMDVNYFSTTLQPLREELTKVYKDCIKDYSESESENKNAKQKIALFAKKIILLRFIRGHLTKIAMRTVDLLTSSSVSVSS